MTRAAMKPKANRATSHAQPGNLDCCQTPGYALTPLLPYLPATWRIWECASGEGHLANALRSYDYAVTESDVLGGLDFFSYVPAAWDCIVTNPPYSIKYRWLARCYALGKPFALLMPVETLGSGKAQAMFREYGVEVLLLNRRVNFKMPNAGWTGQGAQFPVAWFTWQMGLGASLVYGRLDGQLSLLEAQP